MKRLLLLSFAFGLLACSPAAVSPAPKTVHRIAVLPPFYADEAGGAALQRQGNDSGAPRLTALLPSPTAP